MKIIERTFNAETGETIDIERDETAKEKAKREAYELEFATEKAQAEAKEAIRASANEKLSALGLTTEEIAALTK